VWIRELVTPITQGRDLLLRGLMIDITEAQLTEQAMRLSEQKFASLFHHCPDMEVLANCADGRFLAGKSTFEQHIGIAADDDI
ncbi:hypothetical protein ACV356_32655, partial [Pseudomonas aeruginosa]